MIIANRYLETTGKTNGSVLEPSTASSKASASSFRVPQTSRNGDGKNHKNDWLIGMIFTHADPRYADRLDDKQGGDMERVREAIALNAELADESTWLWLTSEHMRFLLKPTGGWIIQEISAAIMERAKAVLKYTTTPDCTPTQQKQEQQEWQELQHDIYVSTCSRMKSTAFKNSFHIVVNNIIFPNNHDGMMKEFVSGLGFPDYIDTAVYTRNRCIRTELSAKRGEVACFKNIVPDFSGFSEQCRAERLVLSLITHFDPGLASVCFKNQAAWLAAKNDGVANKRTARIISDAPSKKSKTQSDQVSLLLDAYFKHIFCDEASTVVTIRPIREKDPLPFVMQGLLARHIVKPCDISFVYIQNAKLCISKLMCAVKHTHHSNNACAVAVTVDGRVDIYARCYGCKSSEYAALAKFDKNKLLPSLAKNDAFRRIVHSPYGIECVTDTVNRKRVIGLFQMTEGSIKKMLEGEHEERREQRIYTAAKGYVTT